MTSMIKEAVAVKMAFECGAMVVYLFNVSHIFISFE